MIIPKKFRFFVGRVFFLILSFSMDKTSKIKQLQCSQRRMELFATRSEAEKSLYKTLLALGLNVVRQQPFYTGRKVYFADLYVPALRLVIEVDGGYHFTSEQKRLDTNRSAGLRKLGLHVCRFKNSDVRDIEKVKSKIRGYMRR